MKSTTSGAHADTDRQQALAKRYVHALERYVLDPKEVGLTTAHDLGREALDDGLGVLAVTAVAFQGLAAVLKHPWSDRDRDRVLNAVQRFTVESLASFEMAHRGYAEANRALRRLNEVLEAQARRIASALHDEAAQLLASVHFALAELAIKLADDRGQDIDDIRALLTQAEDRLRSLAHELRPPVLNNLGLVAALRFLATAAAKRWGLSVTVDGAIDRKLSPAVETTLYRIAQEAVTNVAKHAAASTAHIDVWQTNDIVGCSIRDDGIGFVTTAEPASSQGLGLVEMQERAAALGGTIHMGPNFPHGAAVTVEIPLEATRTQ